MHHPYVPRHNNYIVTEASSPLYLVHAPCSAQRGRGETYTVSITDYLIMLLVLIYSSNFRGYRHVFLRQQKTRLSRPTGFW